MRNPGIHARCAHASHRFFFSFSSCVRLFACLRCVRAKLMPPHCYGFSTRDAFSIALHTFHALPRRYPRRDCRERVSLIVSGQLSPFEPGRDGPANPFGRYPRYSTRAQGRPKIRLLFRCTISQPPCRCIYRARVSTCEDMRRAMIYSRQSCHARSKLKMFTTFHDPIPRPCVRHVGINRL